MKNSFFDTFTFIGDAEDSYANSFKQFKMTNSKTTTNGILYKSPTGNCQLASIGLTSSFILKICAELLEYDSNMKPNLLKLTPEIENKIKEISLATFVQILERTAKNLILIDIREDVYQYFLLFIPEKYYVLNQTYHSTNGTTMRIIIFNVYQFCVDGSNQPYFK